MPVRRFNYTGRKRILHNQVAITLHDADDGSAPTFTVELNLDDLELPPDARLVIVSSRNLAAMRFPWGTVGNPTPPANCRLDDTRNNPLFRVMALDESERLLALADRVQPRRANRRESLLPLLESDLGNEVWQLDFGDVGDNPTLLVNRNIPGISASVRQDNAFRGLVIPEVLRAILNKAFIVDGHSPGDDAGDWGKWVGFVQSFYDEDPPAGFNDENDAETLIKWIDGAVAAFANQRFNARSMYAATVR